MLASMTTTNAPQHIIDLLEEGLQATRMKEAAFSPTPYGTSSTAYSDKVRETTRLYRQSWVEMPLAVALAYLKGEISLRQAERLWGGEHSSPIDPDIREPKKLLDIEGWTP
jgi:hypothetical protein